MMWRLEDHWKYHCPGGCYIFAQRQELDVDGLWYVESAKVHVPVDMFWGRTPWPSDVIAD